ncbi:MAG TPA: hypothetical protein VMO04_04725 [Chthoniobacterales bacterium]|nr:hypothetical protein [Chthoniobacterales bacterium]
MKPTPQTSQNRHTGFPSMDYNFQTTDDPKSSCSNVYPAKKSPGFHRLSSEFFGEEAYRDYVTNFLVFSVLGLITAWPIISSIIAVARMAHY